MVNDYLIIPDRIVVFVVPYVHNVSDLAFALLLISMMLTFIAGGFGWSISFYQRPRLNHPSPSRLLHIIISCAAGFTNVSSLIAQAIAVWFSYGLIAQFPIQGVEFPHHVLLVILSVLCGGISTYSAYRYADDLLEDFEDHEHNKRRATLFI